MNLTEFAKEVHENAVAHGWWEKKRSFGEIIALCHSELSEALEKYRNGRLNIYYPCVNGKCCLEDFPEENMRCGTKPYNRDNPNSSCIFKGEKPEGIAIELADCIIRIIDYCEYAGIDIEQALQMKHEYNKTRPYKHGGKKI